MTATGDLVDALTHRPSCERPKIRTDLRPSGEARLRCRTCAAYAFVKASASTACARPVPVPHLRHLRDPPNGTCLHQGRSGARSTRAEGPLPSKANGDGASSRHPACARISFFRCRSGVVLRAPLRGRGSQPAQQAKTRGLHRALLNQSGPLKLAGVAAPARDRSLDSPGKDGGECASASSVWTGRGHGPHRVALPQVSGCRRRDSNQ